MRVIGLVGGREMGFEAAEPVLDVSLFIERGTVGSWSGLWKLRSMSRHLELNPVGAGCHLGYDKAVLR